MKAVGKVEGTSSYVSFAEYRGIIGDVPGDILQQSLQAQTPPLDQLIRIEELITQQAFRRLLYILRVGSIVLQPPALLFAALFLKGCRHNADYEVLKIATIDTTSCRNYCRILGDMHENLKLSKWSQASLLLAYGRMPANHCMLSHKTGP